MKTKLAYLCSSTSWGGLEMNHLRNAQWMQERGHDVVFFCVENSPIAKDAVERNLSVEIIQKHKKYYDFKKGKELFQSPYTVQLGIRYKINSTKERKK